MGKHLTILDIQYIESYNNQLEIDWLQVFHALKLKEDFTTEDFEYYLTNSSLYSSKIEGNSLDANSFFRYRGSKKFPKKKEVQDIEYLIKSYEFANKNEINKSNFLKVHALLSKNLLPAKEQGKVRKYQVGVRDSATLKPIYLAVEPEFVNGELNKLFGDIAILLKRELSYKEVFYYASMIHLWTAKIHPFGDGNGRSARLLEKWFLVSKLGNRAWSIQSEKYYWDNRPAYYKNIALGFNYYALHWERCIPFLLMLPMSLRLK